MNVVQETPIHATYLKSPPNHPLERILNFESKFYTEIAPCRDDSHSGPASKIEDSQQWGHDFRPREARNMPVRDKVTRWLENLSWVEVESGLWVLDSFPGVPSTMSRSSGFLGYSDELEFREKQAREITRVITEKYGNNGEMPARPTTFGHFGEGNNTALEQEFDADLSY